MEKVWFSHREYIYQTEKGRFLWTKRSKIWNWANCAVDAVKTSDGRVLVVVRSKSYKNSTRMGDKIVIIRYMLGFEVRKIVLGPNLLEKKLSGSRKIYGIQLEGRPSTSYDWNENYWIWVYEEEEEKKPHIKELGKKIEAFLSSEKNSEGSNESEEGCRRFIVKDVSANTEIIPVIYQPAVDSLKNFLREIHCKELSSSDKEKRIEVSLIFNDEELRKNFILDPLYRSVRKIRYGRTCDIETFQIVLNKKDCRKSYFLFRNIYSTDPIGGNNVESDDVHGDWEVERPHMVKYFLTRDSDDFRYVHPVVFVNTSNHAMAEHDENYRLWKWEYVPWDEEGPVRLGGSSRKGLDAEYYREARFKALHPVYDWLMGLVNKRRYS